MINGGLKNIVSRSDLNSLKQEMNNFTKTLNKRYDIAVREMKSQSTKQNKETKNDISNVNQVWILSASAVAYVLKIMKHNGNNRLLLTIVFWSRGWCFFGGCCCEILNRIVSSLQEVRFK